jgi:hypothetical protein
MRRSEYKGVNNLLLYQWQNGWIQWTPFVKIKELREEKVFRIQAENGGRNDSPINLSHI